MNLRSPLMLVLIGILLGYFLVPKLRAALPI